MKVVFNAKNLSSFCKDYDSNILVRCSEEPWWGSYPYAEINPRGLPEFLFCASMDDMETFSCMKVACLRNSLFIIWSHFNVSK